MTGDKKVKNIIVLNNVTLESTEASTQAAANRKIVEVYYSDQLNLVAKYTTGASELLTNCYIKVWGYIGTAPSTEGFPYSTTDDDQILADSTNWIQVGTYDLSSGTATFTPTLFKIAGGAGATTYSKHFAFGVTWQKLYFTAYETGVVTNKGTITLHALTQ